MKRPAFQFYPADWRKEPSLSCCSLAARGLWIEMICIAHESDEYGHMSINGRPMTMPQIARMVGEDQATVEQLVAELEDAGVFSRTESGTVFSRRMVRDERVRNVRASAGKMGGNPALVGAKVGGLVGALVEGKDNHLLKQNSKQNPTPSSSSSSSTSVCAAPSFADAQETPSVSAKSKSKTFAAWLAEIRASGEKAVSDYALVWEYAETVCLPRDWVELAWLCFRSRFQDDEKGKRKRYTDWRRVFLRAVKENWFHLWAWSDRDQSYRLTTVGMQADREMKEAA